MRRRRKSSCPTTGEVLLQVAQPATVEWLFNAMRYNHGLPDSLRIFRPVGTTSNEALHYEMNNAFRRVQVRTPGNNWIPSLCMRIATES